MKKYIPDYYKKFQCIAGECKDNCCIGWDIMIDKKSYDKYQGVQTPFKERLRKGICHEEEPQFCMDDKKRCFFLNQDNLCDIYIELGEDALCEICTQHPRFYNEYGHIQQTGLGLACDQAVQLILGQDEIHILEETTGCEKEIDEWAEELMQIETRLFKILEDQEQSVFDRINKIYDLAVLYQEEINATGEISSVPKMQNIKAHKILEKMSQKDSMTYWFEFYTQLEFMDESFKKLLENAKSEFVTKLKEDNNMVNLMHYFMYRHFMKAYEDDNLCDKIRFAILSTLIIEQINQYCQNNNVAYTIADISRMYSKEFEYSEENLECIFEELLFD